MIMWIYDIHFHIWQVSLQLGCNDTCQIRKWYKEVNKYFCKISIPLVKNELNSVLVTPMSELSTKACVLKDRANGTVQGINKNIYPNRNMY